MKKTLYDYLEILSDFAAKQSNEDWKSVECFADEIIDQFCIFDDDIICGPDVQKIFDVLDCLLECFEDLRRSTKVLESFRSNFQSQFEPYTDMISDYTLISDNYINEYLIEYFEEIHDIPSNLYNYIDFDSAAADMKQDYTHLEISGSEFWVRA